MRTSIEIHSENIKFRFISVNDADFVLNLRTDDKYNKHLSRVDDDLKKQIDWIKAYKKKEFNGDEYYFIIQRQDTNEKIGTVRIYDFDKVNNSFSWGSWILNEKKTKLAALESALMVYDFCFNNLKFNRCHMDMRKDNLHVQKFHKRFGVEFVNETDIDIIGHYYKDVYNRLRPEFIKPLVKSD